MSSAAPSHTKSADLKSLGTKVLTTGKKYLYPGLALAGVGTGIGVHATRDSRAEANARRRNHVILSLLGAGALTGAGMGGLQALVKHYQLLRDQAEAEKQRDLALKQAPDPLLKEAAGPGWTPTALGLLAALVGGVASHKMVGNAYQSFRRKELERMLQDAEEGHTQALLAEHDQLSKQAGESLRWQELLIPLMIASLPATALASAYGVNKLLNRTFNEEDMTQATPTPITQDQMPSVLIAKQKERQSKTASWVRPWDDFRQSMLDTALELPNAGELRDLVSVAAAGGLRDMEKVAVRHGFGAVADSIRGAGCRKPPPFEHAIGTLLLLKSATLGLSVDMLAAGEIKDHTPGMVKVASLLSPDQGDILCKLAALVAGNYRVVRLGLGDELCDAESGMLKQAAAVQAPPPGHPADILQQLLQEKNQEGDPTAGNSDAPEKDPKELLQSVSDSGEDSDPNQTKIPVSESQPSGDPVDAIFG